MFSCRLELMRQIYNAESPPMVSGLETPTNGPCKTLGLPLSPDENERNVDVGGQQQELLQCLAAACANASRLSLANLLPSRLAKHKLSKESTLQSELYL